MRIIAIQKETEGLTKRDFIPHLRDEAQKGWDLYKEGIIREMYFREDKPEAVLILECKDEGEAEEKLATLPLVQKGLISFELIPLRPYHGYERLFEKDFHFNSAGVNPMLVNWKTSLSGAEINYRFSFQPVRKQAVHG